MVVAVPAKRPCGVVSSSGTSMVMHGESSPHMDLAISAKLGGDFCCCMMGPPSGVFALWLETIDELAAGVVVVDFNCPIPWVTIKEPQALALLLLLWLHSQEVAGFVGSDVLEEIIFTHFNGALLPKTLASMNIISGSTASLSSHTQSTNWCGSPDIGSQAFFTQFCNALAYASFLRLLYVVVLTAKLHNAEG